MDNNNILYRLNSAISKSGAVKSTIKFNGSQVVNSSPLKIMNMKCTTVVDTDFNNMVGSVVTDKMDMYGMLISSATVYQNGCFRTTTGMSAMGTLPGSNTSISRSLSPCIYNSVFNVGGQLYPINPSGFIPVKTKSANQNCQSYTLSDSAKQCINGYVDSLMTVSMISSCEYKVTNIVKTIDSSTGAILEQCTKMDILLSGTRKY